MAVGMLALVRLEETTEEDARIENVFEVREAEGLALLGQFSSSPFVLSTGEHASMQSSQRHTRFHWNCVRTLTLKWAVTKLMHGPTGADLS